MRRCTKCGVEKDLNEFGPDKRRSDGLKSQCRECCNNWQKAYAKGRYDPLVARDKYLKYTYGISLVQYESMLEDQGGRCAICGTTPNETNFHVDHDHSCCPGTKSCGSCLRSLLCSSCNQGLGYFKDNPKLLMSAARYLEDQ